MFYIKSGVFNSGEFKNDCYLHFRVSPTPARAPPGGWGGRGGGLEGSLIPYYQKSCVIYINSGVFISRVFKNDLNFHVVVLPTPTRTSWGGGRKPRGGLSPTPPKIMFYINLQVFNSGEYLHFHFRCPPSPARVLPEGEG